MEQDIPILYLLFSIFLLFKSVFTAKRFYVTIGKALEKCYLINRGTSKSSHRTIQTTVLKIFTRCRMKTNKSVQIENDKLLMDIVEIKRKLSELFNRTGPNTSEYISLSIKLDILMNEYFNEKMEQFI